MGEVSVASADPAKAADVRNIIRTAMDTYKLRAVIVRVTIDGKDVITEAFGNSMTGVPASTDMHFRNGSVAESYLANLLLQLVDEKKVSLDDKISKWLPDLPHADEVSLGNLISLTSGYRDFVPDPEFLKVNDTQPTRRGPGRDPHLRPSRPATAVPARHQLELRAHQLRDPGYGPRQDHWTAAEQGPAGQGARALGTHKHDRPGQSGHRRARAPRLGLRAALRLPPSLPFYVDSTYWDTSWSLAKGAIQTTNIFDMDKTAIAIGNGKLLSLNHSRP